LQDVACQFSFNTNTNANDSTEDSVYGVAIMMIIVIHIALDRVPIQCTLKQLLPCLIHLICEFHSSDEPGELIATVHPVRLMTVSSKTRKLNVLNTVEAV